MSEIRLHDPNTCPNKQLIEKLQKDIQKIGEEFHKMDKQTAVENAKLITQYETIIKMLSDSNDNRELLLNKVTQLERKFDVNEYKTNQATDVISKITWGLVAKLSPILIIVGTILIALLKTWKEV